MLSTPIKLISAAASLALTIGCVGLASPGAAATIENYRVKAVNVDDLDLSGPAGRTVAERRIRSAANEVCGSTGAPVFMEVQCRSQAIAAGLTELDARANATSVSSR